jgi:hypothetical protein
VIPASVRLPGPVYIETCGKIVCRGDVRRVDPAAWERAGVWPAGQRLEDRERLRSLHYDPWHLHSKETVELARRLMSRSGSDLSLVYAHRGHRRQWRTPLLQSLLALLDPGVRAHGLQVEQEDLPWDLVLFGIATLASHECCLIVKDNAIRVGAEEVVAASTTQFLTLSKRTGAWAVQRIVLDDDNSADPSMSAALSLDDFLADAERETKSLSLTGRTVSGCVGMMDLVRCGG